jgi:murein DD-endopeptidase MepM/ murein hydrolase activator NlpD
LLLALLPQRADAAADDGYVVTLSEKVDADRVVVFAHCNKCLEATVDLWVQAQNMHAKPSMTFTFDLHGDRPVEIARLQAIDPRLAWTYKYDFRFQVGTRVPPRATPPEPWVYRLPYAAGKTYTVLQAAHGKFSHFGEEAEAVDFAMPTGALIAAARDGRVIGVRQESSRGVAEDANKNWGNYVVIQHSDGTCALYQHLKQDGALVKLGQQMKAGEALGLAGATGHATEPHLHFAVFNTLDGGKIVTMPVKFAGRDGKAFVAQEGKRY